MSSAQPKKLLIVNILEILRKYTDDNHTLSVREIGEYLERDYGVKPDRKSIRRNLIDLLEFGYEIEYSEIPRISSRGEEETILTDWHLVRTLTDSELRLLIDSLLFSSHIPTRQCQELVKKLEELSSVYFRSRVAHISRLPDRPTDNQQLFFNIELLDEAISRGRKVRFKYAEYGTDKRLHYRRRPDGSEREYLITPYQMAAKEGKYYLICNYDRFDDISNYRIDRIRELQLLDEPGKPFEQLRGSNGQSLDLAVYMQEHIYMFASDTVRAEFRVKKEIISDVLDLFGTDVKFYDETESEVSVSARVNERAMLQFAHSFLSEVVILSPRSLRDRMKEELSLSLNRYD